MSVPAGSSRSPVDDALDRLAELVGALYDRKPIENDYRDALATVRSALEQLREERDAAEEWLGNETRRREAAEVEVQRLREGMENGDRLLSQAGRQLEAAEAEVQRLTAELQHTREGLRDKDGQPIQNAARALLRATDNAERNAALGDLYNLLAATPPSVARTEGDGDCEHDYVFESDDPVTYRCDKCGARSDDGVYPRVGSFHPHKPLSGGGAK